MQSSEDSGILVHISDSCKRTKFSTAKIEQLIKAICLRFGLTHVVISVAIVTDEQIQRLNVQFLKQDALTDCLSFDLSDEAIEPRSFELVVNGEMAVREARKRAHPPQAELALYLTHSLLHQLGFDDKRAQDADKMHQTENQILQDLGYPLVYG